MGTGYFSTIFRLLKIRLAIDKCLPRYGRYKESIFIPIPIKNNGYLKATIDLSKYVSKVHEQPVLSKGTWTNMKLSTIIEFMASFMNMKGIYPDAFRM